MNANLILRTAIAGALSATAVYAPQALALKPASVPAANVLRFSGATATDATVQDLTRLLVGGLCADDDANSATPSTLTTFYSGRNAVEGAQFAALCQGAAGQAFSGQNVAILKESEFGSASGSVFVSSATPTAIDFLDIFNSGFLCRGNDDNAATNDAGTLVPTSSFDNPATIASDTNRQAVRSYTNCTPQAAFTAEAGISDVETGLLGSDGGQGTPTTQFQILFGVPVNLALYRALQQGQGITSRAECDTLAELDTEACVPSLHKATISAIYSGALSNWAELKTTSGANLTSVSNVGLGIGAPASSSAFVCRRGNTSGTQIGNRAYFLAQGCGGSDLFVAATNGTCNGEANGNPYGTAVIVDCNKDGDTSDPNEGVFNFSNTARFAGDASGDVRNCLDDRDDQNRWAIGVLSTENALDGTIRDQTGLITYTLGDIGGTGGDARDTLASGSTEAHQREFRFIRVNDYLPSLEAAANGGYDFYTENACYERTGALSGVEKQLYDALCGPTGLGDLTIIGRLNDGYDNQPFGDGGVMGIPNLGTNVPNVVPAGGFVTQALMDANPVNSYRKSASGVINNCSQSINVTSVGQGTPAANARGPNP